MAWIQPNSTVKLFNGIPLDTSYENCIYFASRTACTAYFSNLTPKYAFDNMSYVRHSNNKIRVNISADNLFDCNYLCFQNTAFGNKWFYAFIVDVEYTNNNCSIITYEIDVVNTYLWDCTLGVSHIIRQHSVTDNIGDNIVDEPLATGNYLVNHTYDKCTINTDVFIIVIMTDETDEIQCRYLDNNLVKAHVYIGTLMNMQELLAEYNERVVAISPIDSSFVNTDGRVYPFEIAGSDLPLWDNNHASVTLTATQPTTSTTLNGYTPKNHKLYTAPYNIIRAVSSQGNTMDYRFEYFGNGSLSPIFRINSNFLPPIQYICRPYNYTFTNEVFNNPDKSVYLDNIPTSQWSLDQYKYWEKVYGQTNEISQITGILQGMATAAPVGVMAGSAFGLPGMIVGGATAAIIGADIGALPSIKEEINARNKADTWINSNTSTSALFSTKEAGFSLQNMCLNASELKIIDDFFTKYGYAQNCLAIPNLHARPKWTYIKCDLTLRNSPIPSNANMIIRKIFNNGTTFWTTADYIGHYELDNSPT